MLVLQQNDGRQYQINAYDETSISVGEQRYTQNLIIAPNALITNWGVPQFSALNPDNLQPILQLTPEILLIGSGPRPLQLPITLLNYLLQNNIGVECMTTAAACRSYMALATEDRQVIAALFIR